MAQFARNLAIGVAAAALLIAGSSVDPSRAETPGRPAQVAEGTVENPRPNYQAEMGDRIDRAGARMKEIGSATADATDEQIADLESAWADVESEWAELQAAADENWDEAKAAMDEAWRNFEISWKETFGDDTVSQ
jgi:hypothetical protein